MLQGLQHFSDYWPWPEVPRDGTPSIVVLETTIWDIAGIVFRKEHQKQRYLPSQVLYDWVEHVAAVMDIIEVGLISAQSMLLSCAR